jgi:hypothetical protein
MILIFDPLALLAGLASQPWALARLIQVARKHLFVLGPSGVGKSSLGHWLERDLALLHLEHDIYPEPGNGIDALGLRAEWNAFHDRGDASALVKVLESKAWSAGKMLARRQYCGCGIRGTP